MKLNFRILLTAILLVAILAAGFAWFGENFGVPAALGVAALLFALNQPAISHNLGAAAAPVNTPTRTGDIVYLPVAAATKIWQGSLVARDAAGRAVPASDTAGLRVVGRAEETVDNTAGAAGDLSINIRLGVFKYANSAANAVDADDVGKMAIVEDDMTVAETDTNLVCAGRILAVESDGVWIDTRFAYFGPKSMPTLTSTNGVAAAAAADLAGLAAEAEKIGDDVRALHASLFG